MAIASTLKNYLETRGVDYDLVTHDHSQTSREAAHAANVAERQVAKAVVLKDAQGMLVGVLPADKRLDLDRVNEQLGRHLQLASESELARLFEDCEAGAAPALGEAYGLSVIWDDRLGERSDVYIEAGDHEHLIHLRGQDFARLMSGQEHGGISA